MTMGRSSFSCTARGRPGNPLGPLMGKNPSVLSSGPAYFDAPVVCEKPSGFGLFPDTFTSPFRLPGASLSAPGKRRKPALQPVFVFSLAREAPSKKRSGGGRGIRTPEGLHLSGFQDHRHRPLGHPSGDPNDTNDSGGPLCLGETNSACLRLDPEDARFGQPREAPGRPLTRPEAPKNLEQARPDLSLWQAEGYPLVASVRLHAGPDRELGLAVDRPISRPLMHERRRHQEYGILKTHRL